VSKDHPALSGAIGLDEFLSWPHALVSVFGGRTGVVDDALAALGRRRHVALWLPYFATAATVVAQSDLILTIPSRAASELARGDALVRFAPPIPIEGFGYRMLWHDRSHADPGHKWLRDLIGTTVADEGPGQPS
jgi:DNA-binding transcriptional LysR family regulator